MSYPIQVPITYVNPQGNLIASGLYRSYLTQDIANDFPSWMSLRNNNQSIGQQFLACESILLEDLQRGLEYNIRSKFLDTCPVDEIDILFKVKVPGNVNMLNASASGVRVIAAPSGLLNGAGQIQLQESDSLEDFYYNELPTRLEILSSGNYTPTINGSTFNAQPSGVFDKQSKMYDIWKKKHDLTWCIQASGVIQKQDAQTMETYESYPWADTGGVSDLWYSKGFLWTVGNDSQGSYISILSSKTQIPPDDELDYLARYNLGIAFPSGTMIQNIMIDQNGSMWLADDAQLAVYGVAPRYDYFTYDPKTRSIYMREDYRNSGVFISNT